MWVLSEARPIRRPLGLRALDGTPSASATHWIQGGGVTRVRGAPSKGTRLVRWWKGVGADERQDPERYLIGGQVIVELLLAFALAAILIPALLSGLISARSGRVQEQQRIIATGLLREGEEAVRSFRDANWTNIADLNTSTTYHWTQSGSNWVLQPNPEKIGDFTRSVNVSDLVPPDPSLRKFTITVSWNNLFLTNVTSTFYLTRWKNLSFADSGTVQPQGQGFGDWCKPSPALIPINLNRQGHPTSLITYETPGGVDGNRVLAGTGANSSGPAFSNLKVMGDSPPAVTNLGDYNGSPQVKVNGMASDGSYAFVATDNKGVEILNIGASPIAEIGSFNPSQMKNVNDVYVVGNTGYAVTSDKFYIFSISADRKTTSQIGSMPLANGAKVKVDANNLYAYVPNPDPSGELKIIDVHTHPSNLTSADVKNVDVNGGAGRDVFINNSATRAYLATAASPTQPEFFIIDIHDPTNPSVFTNNATYDTNGMDPYGVTIVTDNRAIIVGTGGYEYQVFTVVNDQVQFCPNHAAGTDYLNIDTGVFAVASLKQTNTHAYSYIATGDAGAELGIIEGGPGGGGSGGNGTFESATLPSPDPGHDVAFNSFTGTVDPDLSYKISIKHGSGSNCGGVTFSDPDFIPLVNGPMQFGSIGGGYVNPGECMRYRVINTSGVTKSFAVSFNYSP